MVATGDAGAIEDVSATLAGVLEDGINVGGHDVVITSPDAVRGTGSPTVSLFLYDVTERAEDSSPRPREVSLEDQQQPPLTVELSYLVTAFPSGSGNESQKAKQGHELIGEAMWAFRRSALITGSALRGSLEGQLQIARSEDHETIVDVWNTFAERSYLPSVPYSVGPVAMDAGEPTPADRVATMTLRGEDG